jgi:hypothetical protein
MSSHLESRGSGKEGTPEYVAWVSMKQRCLNSQAANYIRYGFIGVTICQEWIDSYEQFLKDVGRRPSSKYSLDRYPDSNGNYEPGNVRWATHQQQSNNRENTVMIEYNGKNQALTDWARELGVGRQTLRKRYEAGLTPEQIITKPVGRWL